MHHSESRYGSYAKYRETISGNGDWRSYKLFTDAGLNTKGNAVINIVKNRAINFLKLSSTFSSSYYDLSSERGYQYKINGSGWINSMSSSGVIAPNTSIYPQSDVIYSGIETLPAYVNIRPYIINPEGTYYGAEVGFEATKPIFSTNSYSYTI